MKMNVKEFLNIVGNLPDWMLTEELLENREYARSLVRDMRRYLVFQLIALVVAGIILYIATHEVRIVRVFIGMVLVYMVGRWFLYTRTIGLNILLSKDSAGKFGLLKYFLTKLSHRPALSRDMQKSDYVTKCFDVLSMLAMDVEQREADLRIGLKDLSDSASFPALIKSNRKLRVKIFKNDLDEARTRFNDHFIIMARIDVTNHLKSTFFTKEKFVCS